MIDQKRIEEIKQLCDEITHKSSDDFGHDCQQLLIWEAEQAQDLAFRVVPQILAAYEELRLENEKLKAENDNLAFGYQDIIFTIKEISKGELVTDIGRVDPFVDCAIEFSEADNMVGKTYKGKSWKYGCYLIKEGTLEQLKPNKSEGT